MENNDFFRTLRKIAWSSLTSESNTEPSRKDPRFNYVELKSSPQQSLYLTYGFRIRK